MKNKVFSLMAVVLFMSSSLNVGAITPSQNQVNYEKSITVDEDGPVCDWLARKARALLAAADVFSESTLDLLEDAIAAACDELL